MEVGTNRVTAHPGFLGRGATWRLVDSPGVIRQGLAAGEGARIHWTRCWKTEMKSNFIRPTDLIRVDWLMVIPLPLTNQTKKTLIAAPLGSLEQLTNLDWKRNCPDPEGHAIICVQWELVVSTSSFIFLYVILSKAR